ncbi:MAG: SDR family oxidoreductase [Bacteroidota bacterium]
MTKTAIVTGASKGIGKSIALQLAGLKYNVAIVGRNVQLLNNLKQEIEAKGVKCCAVEADLNLENSPSQIIEKVIACLGQIDVLVNNAGMANSGSVAETTIETWNQLFTVNARAPFFLSQAAIPYLKESINPVIINIGSVVDFKGYANQAAYASSKHALAGFTKVMAKEVQKDGIKVHLISPGGVNTEMVREMRPDIDTSELIQPEEIAELVEFLITRKGKGTIDHFYIRRQSGLAFD